MENGLPFSILVVDDDADDRAFIDEAFLDIGFGSEIKKFINGPALLHYLGTLTPELFPHLIVLDNTLPGMNALELLTRLRQDAAYQQIPVVVYTTLVTAAKKEELLAAGAITCLQKGETMEKIREVARKLRQLAEQGTGARPASCKDAH